MRHIRMTTISEYSSLPPLSLCFSEYGAMRHICMMNEYGALPHQSLKPLGVGDGDEVRITYNRKLSKSFTI